MISKLRPVCGQHRALCCTCGEVRGFSHRYRGGNRVDETGPGPERCTIDLKCGSCGRRTRHAYLLDFSPARDAAERWNRPLPADGYDPFREAAEHWPDWTFTEIPLPDGIVEIIDPDRRKAYYDRAGWDDDPVLGLAHVLAHLNLGHHHVLDESP